jgi:hypothetical protein
LVSDVETSVMLWMVPFWAFMVEGVVVKVRWRLGVVRIGSLRVRKERVAVRFSIAFGKGVGLAEDRGVSTYVCFFVAVNMFD